jgi:hypothetical protein
MNVLKVRKLAAIVAGGALLGAAVAPMVSAITSAEAKSLTYNAEMSPNVNIVVGSSAAISDGVWAGNIARKVVEKAVMEKVYTGGATGNGTVAVTDIATVLALGGTVTTTGGKVFDNTGLNSTGATAEYQQDIGKDPLSFLTDKSISYKYNGSSTTIDVKDTIGVKLNPKFDTASQVKDLDVRIDAGDVNYVVNLGAGIPTVATANVAGDFTDTSDDNIRIPFFGKTFLVQKVDIDDSNNVVELRLVEDKAKQTFVAGESFSVQGIGAYAGQTLTVTVASVVATGPAATSYQSKFNLTDEAGNVVDTQTVAAGNFVEFEDASGDDVISGDVYLDTASVNTGTNEGTVEVLVGTSSVRLLDGQNYPYNEQVDAENINGPYQVTLQEVASSNRLQKIIIRNATKSSTTSTTTAAELVKSWPSAVWDADHPLFSSDDSLTTAGAAGTHEFSFLDGTGALGEDLFKVRFDGFKEDQTLVYLQIGNNEVQFRDAQDTTHTIPMWFRLAEAGDSGTGTAASNSNGIQFSFDNGNKTLYYDVNQSTQDFNVTDGTILNGVAVDTNGGGLINTDLGPINIWSAPTNIVLSGVSYQVIEPLSPTVAQIHLRADGWVRFAKASLNSSTSSSDFVDGASASNVTGVGAGGMTTAQLAHVFFYDDANVMNAGNLGGIGYGPRLPLSGDNYSVAYGFFVNESGTSINSRGSSEGVYLSLLGADFNANSNGAGRSIPVTGGLQKSKNLTFFGTDRGEDGTVDSNFYVPQIDNYGQNPSAETVMTAAFGVDENNGSAFGFNTRVYIDTRDDQIPVLGGSSNKISTPTSDVNYGGVVGVAPLNNVSLSLTTDSSSSSSLTDVYTDWGTRISIADGQTAEFWMPDARPNVSFTVSGESTTSEVTGGEEITVKEGETGTFTTGTQVTVKDVTYTATVTDGSTVVTNGTTGFTYKTPASLNGKAQVYTDAQSVPGPKIVVGGPAVNALASEVADLLNASGDKVSGVYGSNIIVAGYTAADTGDAAQELISALDAI